MLSSVSGIELKPSVTGIEPTGIEPTGIEFKFPLRWEDIKAITDNPYVIKQCLRSEEVDKQYKMDKQNNVQSISSLKEAVDIKIHMFTNAKYPYHIQNTFCHRVLWLKNMSTNDLWVEPYDMQTIRKLIEEDMKSLGFTQYLFFQNPVQYRTVALLPHYHIFYS